MSMSPQAIQQMLLLAQQGGSLTGGPSALTQTLGQGADVAGIYGGLSSGNPSGYASALANGLKLDGSLTGNAGASQLGGAVGSGLGIASGIQQGGVSGYGGALDSALRLGSMGANFAGDTALSQGLGTAAGALAVPLSLYNFGKNWQSGATGPDALGGASAGAAIGSVVPGLGTLVGGAIGAGVGALSSAFGGGKHDPETTALQSLIPQYSQAVAQDPNAAAAGLSNLSPQQSFETIAGAMDAKNNTPGHSQAIEQVLGRGQEGTLLNDIANQINTGYSSGSITPGESASQVYSSVVNPWLNQETNGIGIQGPSSGEGGVLTGALQNLVGDYMNGSLTSNTPIGISGQEDTTLPTYLGLNANTTPSTTSPLATGMSSPTSTNPQPQGTVSAIQHAPMMRASTGGSMRKRHFDTGGSSSDDPFDPTSIDTTLFTPGVVSGLDNSFSSGFDAASNPGSSGALESALASNPLPADFSSQPVSTGTGGSGGSSSGKGIAGGLTSLLTGLGLSPSSAQTLSQLGLTAASLAPIIASLTGGSKSGQASQPATTAPAGYAAPSTPYQTPNYSRSYTGPTTSSWTPQQWYTYGEGPEQSFFSNNQLPSMPGLSPQQQATPTPTSTPTPGNAPTGHASGGALGQVHEGEGYVGDPGYGDGTSDDVNAKLSGGEYVMDGGTVSLLGNGSNEAGARQLDQLRQRVRQHAGRSLVKGKQFMKAKEPAAYLGKGK